MIHLIFIMVIAIIISTNFLLVLYLHCYLFIKDFENFQDGHLSIGFEYHLALLYFIFSLFLLLFVKIHQSLSHPKMMGIPNHPFHIFFEFFITFIMYFFYVCPSLRLIYMKYFFYHCFIKYFILYNQYFSYEDFLLNSYYE